MLMREQLLAALAGELNNSPRRAAAAFESPKVVAHGDFACTAATAGWLSSGQPLASNRGGLMATPAFAQWVGCHRDTAQAF